MECASRARPKPRTRGHLATTSLPLPLGPAAAVAAALVGALAASPTEGQEGPPPLDEAPYLVPRLIEPIEFDGRVVESAWEAIQPLAAVAHLPTFGSPLTEPTEFRIAYDSEYVYFSCRAYDSDPGGILAYSLERDEQGFRSDFCSLYLDTLNDEENALQFKTGPAGNRSDAQRMDDGERSDNSWNAFWDAAVSRDTLGWYAEIRIPFSSLLFQTVDGQVVMGVSMLRNISRKNERHVHPAIPPDLGQFAYTKPSLMRKIVFQGIQDRGTPTYVTPYALAGGGYSHVLDEPATGYARTSSQVTEAGLDVRMGIASSLTLDLTVNTDFAQVEADDQQVNLTRFSLFFPEKRRFFQERSSNFEYALSGQDRLFHSRTIGLAGGRPVRILGGARLVGRTGEWDVGVLNVQTGDSEGLPSENMGVARLRRRVLNDNSYVGGILTTRIGSGGRQNIVYGLDGIFRVARADYLVLDWAQSFDTSEGLASTRPVRSVDRGVARVSLERRGQDGLTYVVDLSRTGEVFNPGLGFLRQADYVTGRARAGYLWRSEPGARLFTYALELEGAIFRRNVDGQVETVEIEPRGVVQSWGLHQLMLSVPFNYENLRAPFSLPEGTVVPAGIYRFAWGRLQYSSPQSDQLRLVADVEAGRFFDGQRAAFGFGPVWDPSAHVNLSATYRVDRVVFSGRDQGFTAHLMRLRAQVMLSTTMSAVGFVQYNNTDHAVIANVRLRYNPREGNDLYIVWNESLVTDRTSFVPVQPLSTERTIVVKYAHTFQFGI